MEFDYRTSTGLEETDSALGGHTQNLVHVKILRKGAVTPKETESNKSASVRRSPVEVWVGSGSPWERGYWQQQSWEGSLGISSLGGCY